MYTECRRQDDRNGSDGEDKKSIETFCMPVPVAALSKPWVCDLSLAGIAGSTPIEGLDVCLM